MPTRELHEDIFQTCLSRCQVYQLRALPLHFRQQRRDRFVRLIYLQREQSVLGAH